MNLLFGVICTALLVSLCAGQFSYSQEFGAGAVAPPATVVKQQFDDNRTFRLRQVHHQPQALVAVAPPVGVPIQREIIFPGQGEVLVAPSVVAPIPVVRAVEVERAPVVRKEEGVVPPIVQQRPKVLKRVRVLKEKPRPVAVESPRGAVVHEIETPREIISETTRQVIVESPIPEVIRESPRVLSNERALDLAEEDRLQREEEAKNAHYSFSSSVQDSINDHAIERSESRDGLALKGMYSYSDGFFKRTVHYEADQDGYRVVREEIEPIGSGPVFNPQGKASVESSLSGRYSITADDINMPKKNSDSRRVNL